MVLWRKTLLPYVFPSMQFLTDRKIRLFLAWGIVLVPLYPLAVWSGFLFPFITGKTLFLYALIEVLCALWLIAVMRGAISLRPLRSAVAFAFGTFLLLFGITSVFGVDFWRSFWSTYERMDGLLTWIHLGAFFIVLTTTASEKLWRRLTAVSFFVYFLVSLSAVLIWFISGIDARVGGVFDNPSYLASYTLLHIFLIGYVYSRVHTHTMRLTLIGLLFLGILALIASGTRGAFLGLASGGVLIALFSLWRRIAFVTNVSILIRGIFVGGIALALFAGVWGAGAFYNSISSSGRTIPVSVEKVLAEPRIAVWHVAWQGIKERPLLGWGGGAFSDVFDTWYDPKLSLEEPWFDRAHSIVFDWLIAGGIVLFLAYASLFIAAFFLLWVHPGQRVFNHATQVAFSGFFVAYVAQGVFLFDTTVGLVPLIATLAYLNWSAVPSVWQKEKPHWSPVVPFVVLGVLLLALSNVVFTPAYVLSNANTSINSANSDEKRSAAFTRSFNNAMFDKENLAILFSKSVADNSSSPSDTPLLAQARSALDGLASYDVASTRLLITTGAMALTADELQRAILTFERAYNRAPKRKDVLRFLREAYQIKH